jgi:DNA polymerase III delta prime subunit
MNMKEKQPKEEKPILRSTVITEDELYEMVYDKVTNKTSYIKVDRLGSLEFFIEKIKIGNEKYQPYPPTNNLVEKGVILFPSLPCPYDNEEEILSEIRTFIHKYLDISEVYEQIATYYVLFTWMYDKFNEVPYLRAIGDFGSGKSRFLQTIGVLCYKPIFTGGATTPSPIFRIVNEVRGTLIIDEADFKFSDMTSEIVKILNSGYQKGTPVLRSEGKGTFEVKAYDVFSPKIVATRETFSDKALESRFLVEEMGNGGLRSDIPRTLKEDFYKDAELIRNKLLMWRLKNYFSPVVYREELIEGIHPRLNQIVIPLLSTINDEDIRERLKKFIVEYNGELVADRGLSWESDIVFAILKLEHEGFNAEITVNEIAKAVNEQIDEKEENLTARKVGWYLRKRLQLKPYRRNRGYVLSFKTNRKKLDFWKERYGITDADIRGEEVHDVNNVYITEDTDKQSQIF